MAVTQIPNRQVHDAAITGVKLNVLTTKGDVMDYTTVAGRKAAGADGTVLIADSTQTDGLRWGADVTTALQTVTTNPSSPANAVVWYNSLTDQPEIETLAGAGVIPRTLFVSNAPSNQNTNTNIEIAFNQFYTLPANASQAGSTYRVRAWGTYSSSNLVPNTIDLKLKYGGTIVTDAGATTASTSGVSSSNKQWMIESVFSVTNTGSSATIVTGGGVVNNFSSLYISTGTAVTGNTTVANAIQCTSQWSTQTVDSTIQMTLIIIEQIA